MLRLRHPGLGVLGTLTSLALLGLTSGSTAQNQVTLLSQVDLSTLGSSAASDCWSYVSGSGREYALICLYDKTAFVEVTDPSNPVVIATKNGPSSTWRDIKVYEDFAYAVSEGGSGIQVFDLANIDSGTVTKLANVTTGGVTSSHNVAIDEQSGFLYRTGGSSEGLRFYDLNQSKTNPPYVGKWSQKYVHDAQVVTWPSGPHAGKEIAFCLTGSSQDLTVVDVTNKASPSVMDSAGWSQSGYSHQGWLDENYQYFYINDEFDEQTYGLKTTTIVMDVSDPSNISLAGKFDNGNPAIGHNGYVKGDLLFEANYSSGVRVFDLSVSALNPPEVGFYDTYAGGDPVSYDGLWSVCPYFPKGTVIGSDQQNGLYVWFAGEELVTVSLTATVPPFLLPGGQVLPVDIAESSPGNLQAGTQMLHYDDGTGWQATPLVSLGGTSYEAQFPNVLCGAEVDYYFSADSTNGLTWKDPFLGPNGPYVSLVATSSSVGFSDDFETNKGWVAENLGATAGDYDRGVPVNDPGWPYDPIADADGSGQCWMTENVLGNSDVDNGGVRVVSPSLDLSGSNPIIQYDYYLYLTDQGGIDGLRVKANDNAGSGWQEVAAHTTSGQNAWRRHYILGSDLTAAGVSLTNNVTLRFIARDDDPQSTVEAAVDAFFVLNLSCGALANYCTAGSSASGCQIGLSGSGTPSLSLASGFTISGTSGEGSKDGIFFFGQNGKQGNSWGTGTSYQCVTPPVKRTPIQSGGGTPGACDGSWSLDFNAYVTANPQKAPTAGTPTQIQLWYRDPLNSGNQTTSLSDAGEFTMAP